MNIIHIITGLEKGGAEKILYELCVLDKNNRHLVISLTNLGYYGKLLRKKNFCVCVYDCKKKFFIIFNFLKLIWFLKKKRPDIVQTWMYHADLIGGLAARFAGIKNVIWNIRQSQVKKKNLNKTTFWLVIILSKLSWYIPSAIIVCAKYAIKVHSELGYCKKKFYYIPNGYNLSVLKPEDSNNFFIRKKFNLNHKIPLICTVARYNPEKDHLNLFKAISLLKDDGILFFCVLFGSNIKNSNEYLVSLVKKFNLKKIVKLLGISNRINLIMSEIDIFILPSRSEAFPNVVAEAMACKTPCVVTDVGDAAFIVGKTGWIVPAKSPDLLAKSIKIALLEMKKKNWKVRCDQARIRIEKNFIINDMIKSYNRVWLNIQKKSF
jgi:glycosyltransferase involved in cell wall biosynthesis